MEGLELQKPDNDRGQINPNEIQSPLSAGLPNALGANSGVVGEDDLLNLREVKFGYNPARWRYPRNNVNNQKYTPLTFLPLVLFNQFKYFFNLFFLIVALSQAIEALRVGFLISFVAPLVFVVAVTIVKEAYDDHKRAERDKQIN